MVRDDLFMFQGLVVYSVFSQKNPAVQRPPEYNLLNESTTTELHHHQ